MRSGRRCGVFCKVVPAQTGKKGRLPRPTLPSLQQQLPQLLLLSQLELHPQFPPQQKMSRSIMMIQKQLPFPFPQNI